MHTTIHLSLSLLATTTALAAVTSSCNANNCLRQVRASSFPTRAGAADCSSYLSASASSVGTTTVVNTVANTPITSTKTTTNASPTRPAYASGCTNDAQYRSACSCIGVSTTSASMSTSTPSAFAPLPTFALQVNYPIVAAADPNIFVSIRTTPNGYGGSSVFPAEADPLMEERFTYSPAPGAGPNDPSPVLAAGAQNLVAYSLIAEESSLLISASYDPNNSLLCKTDPFTRAFTCYQMLGTGMPAASPLAFGVCLDAGDYYGAILVAKEASAAAFYNTCSGAILVTLTAVPPV